MSDINETQMITEIFEAGWYAAIDAALKEIEALTGDKPTASSGLSRTFKTMAKIKKLRDTPQGIIK